MISSRLISFSILLIGLAHLVSAQSTTIREVKIEGNKRTNDWVIQKELAFVIGKNEEVLTLKDQFEVTENRLLNLNLFNSVSVDYQELDSSIVVIRLVEKWYIWPIPFIEFSDRNFNIWQGLDFDKSRTNYGLYLFNYNLFGNNHTLKISLIDGYHQKFGLNYRVPFLHPNSNIGMTINASYTSQNEVWIQTTDDKLQFYSTGQNNLIEEQNYSVMFSTRRSLPEWFYMGAGFARTEVSDSVVQEKTALDYLVNSNRKQDELYLFGAYEWDTRDNRYLPLAGEYFSTAIQASNFGSSTSNLGVYIKAQKFSQLSNDFYMALSGSMDWNSNDSLPYHNYKALGYDRAVRGFEYYVVDGHASILLNSALRYHLINEPHLELPFIPFENYNFLPINVYLEAFIDFGRTFSNRVIVRNELPNTNLVSTGIGVNTLFYNDRVLRFEYSYNSLNQTGFFIHFKKAI